MEPIPERRAMAERRGIRAIDPDGAVEAVLAATDGRGADGVVDAVGMEAHGNPVVSAAHHLLGALPAGVAQPLLETAGLDRTAALMTAIGMVRRGGTVSISGVYAGEADPMPMKTLFDKQVTLRMGQCNVRRWTATLLPLVEDAADPLGTEDLVTHRPALSEAAAYYELFQKKEDGCIKVVLRP